MGQLFKRSPEVKLKKEYDKLMAEAYRLSHIDRRKSDEKYVMAESVMTQLMNVKKPD